jgi:hypothetical protein
MEVVISHIFGAEGLNTVWLVWQTFRAGSQQETGGFLLRLDDGFEGITSSGEESLSERGDEGDFDEQTAGSGPPPLRITPGSL